MKRYRKKIGLNILTVLAFTIVMVVGFGSLKNYINRSEAIRAMEIIAAEVLEYKKSYGFLPSESYVMDFIERANLVRVGNFQYRAAWLEYGCEPNETVLAYSPLNYRGFVPSGGAVIWLSGKVQWLDKKTFEGLLNTQQKQRELKWLQEHLGGY